MDTDDKTNVSISKCSSLPSKRQKWRPSAYLTPAQQETQGIFGNSQCLKTPTQADNNGPQQSVHSDAGDRLQFEEAASGYPSEAGDRLRTQSINNGRLKPGRAMSSGQIHGAQFALEQFSVRPELLTRSNSAWQITETRQADREIIEQVRLHNEAHLRRRHGCDVVGAFRRLWRDKSQLPSLDKLEEVVHRAFPPRMDLQVWICDIKANSGEMYTTTLGKIEQFWKDKPDDVLFRWIHAPLGQGLLHSSVEDMFRFDWHPGKAFRHAGTSGFPYVEIESVHFRAREDIQHLRDVRQTFGTNADLARRLSERCLDNDTNETLASNLAWREKYLRTGRDFWALAASDIPDELSESLTFQGPLQRHWVGKGPLSRSSIGGVNDPQFKDANLVVAPFRFFHRSDGVLLTMSAATGIDQLHKDFHHDIKASYQERLANPNASVVAGMMRGFVEIGAAPWYEHSVEYLMVHLITEIATAPQNIASGRSALPLLASLQGTITDLKKKRYDRWEPRKTVRLVQDYLVCMDDLKSLSSCSGRKLDLLKRLLKDLEEHAQEEDVSHINHKDSETSIKRVGWAIRAITEDQRYMNEMHEDLLKSLNTLFQLRSVEQSELAMLTDSQNRALFIFTGVTVVFLPLSFFTSYYGMNLASIRETNLGESSFWKICGTFTFGIVLFVVLSSVFYRRIHPGQVSKSKEQEIRLIEDGLNMNRDDAIGEQGIA